MVEEGRLSWYNQLRFGDMTPCYNGIGSPQRGVPIKGAFLYGKPK